MMYASTYLLVSASSAHLSGDLVGLNMYVMMFCLFLISIFAGYATQLRDRQNFVQAKQLEFIIKEQTELLDNQTESLLIFNGNKFDQDH